MPPWTRLHMAPHNSVLGHIVAHWTPYGPMDYVMLHCPLLPCPCTCHMFVCLFFFTHQRHMLLVVCLFSFPVCLFVRHQANAESNHACCIRRGLGRGLRSSLLLNSSLRCTPLSRIVYLC